MKPACMDQREYDEWLTRNNACFYQASSPCSDCPLAWAQEQERIGNCLVFNGADYVLGSPRGDTASMPRHESARRSRVRGGQQAIGREHARNERLRMAGEMHAAGLTPRQISERMGVHLCTAKRYVREWRAVR